MGINSLLTQRREGAENARDYALSKGLSFACLLHILVFAEMNIPETSAFSAPLRFESVSFEQIL